MDAPPEGGLEKGEKRWGERCTLPEIRRFLLQRALNNREPPWWQAPFPNLGEVVGADESINNSLTLIIIINLLGY